MNLRTNTKFNGEDIFTKIFSNIRFRDYLMTIVSKTLEIDKKTLEDNYKIEDFETSADSESETLGLVFAELRGTESRYVEINYEYYDRDELKRKKCNFIFKPKIFARNLDLKCLLSQINIKEISECNELITRYELMEETYHIPRENDILELVDINLDVLKKMDNASIEKLNLDSLERLFYIFVNGNIEEISKVTKTPIEDIEKIINESSSGAVDASTND